MPNKLIHETSPYLLQHANNPVDWHPWGEEALRKAREESKPILVSIGYAACHWCHVMEKESFEDQETADLMNQHFVNIKIDREERPDLDHIYMDAVQTMTGAGGWPLNVFLTPGAKPFFGGTYFPGTRAFSRPSWKEVLLSVAKAFHEQREEIDSRAENLTALLLQSNSLISQTPAPTSNVFVKEKIEEVFQQLMSTADKRHGGFGGAPKFPQTFSVQFLLRYYYVTRDREALNQACLSLDKMIDGGIYDQLGGGFARYSTDQEWLVPHFEKMLYDNALLLSVLSEAFQLTGKERYREVIEETIGFIQTQMMHPGGAFYSALDADSEGEEGKYYLWHYDEIKKLLGAHSEFFCSFYHITEGGNLPSTQLEWGRQNILHVKKSPEAFVSEKNLSMDELETILKNGKSILMNARNKRIKPLLDDKIILGWNALMNTACSKAFAATGKKEYRRLAINNMKFLLAHFENTDENYFYHTWKNGQPKNRAFLDDYAFLIQALMHLQEITGDFDWLKRSRQIAGHVISNFSDADNSLFFFTDIRQQDLILRKTEIYDGATPSGNATMAYNIYHLSIIFDLPEWRKRAEKMVSLLQNAVIRYPASFGVWGNLLMEMVQGTEEIVVTGKDPFGLAGEVLAQYIPHKVFLISTMGSQESPLLSGKLSADQPFIYLCRAYSCLKPVAEAGELSKLLNNRNKN